MKLLNFLKSKKPKIIFIFGAPRGGTTWLWSLFESNKDTIPFIDGIEKNIGGKYKTSESGIYIKRPDLAYETICEFYKDNPKKTLIEKTPLHTLVYEKINQDFPGNSNLVIYRHPVAIVNSILTSEMEVFKNCDMKSSINLVKHYYIKLEELSRLESNIVVTYEDLLRDTYEILLKLFTCFNLDITEIDQIIKENNNRTKIDVEGVFRKGKANSYKEDLSEEEITFLRKELSKEIRMYKRNLSP